MNKQLAEFIGTFALVFFGCGAAAIGGMGTGATAVNLLGIASAFGFAIVAMAYGIGPISGCHVNPAVSFGVFVAGPDERGRDGLLLDRPGTRRDRRGGRALSHPVGQGVGLERRPRPERLGRRLSWRIQRGLGASLRDRGDLPVPRHHSRRHPSLHADGALPASRSASPWSPSTWSGSTSPAPRSTRPARSARRWSASPPTRSGSRQLWLFIVAPLIGAGLAGFLYREGALLDQPKA